MFDNEPFAACCFGGLKDLRDIEISKAHFGKLTLTFGRDPVIFDVKQWQSSCKTTTRFNRIPAASLHPMNVELRLKMI